MGCTDILFKINKLSRFFIYRLEKRRFGNDHLTLLPSWHLRESSVYKTPRTSEPPIPELARGAHAHRPCLERKQWERREGPNPVPQALDSTAPAHASTTRPVRCPGAPRSRPELWGAAHLRRRGRKAALTKQGQGHCKGARQLLAAARQSTRSSQANQRSPHRPAALTPRGAGSRRGVVGTPARWEAAGRDPGGRCKKSYLRVIVRRTRTRGDPLASGEPALVAAIRALRGARAGGGTCRAGRLDRGAVAGGGAAPRRRRRRRGEQQPRGAPGGARSLRIPRPRRRHLAIASPTGSAAASPPASPSGGRAECVPMATGAREGRGRALLLPPTGPKAASLVPLGRGQCAFYLKS